MIYSRYISPFLDWYSNIKLFLRYKFLTLKDILRTCLIMFLVTFFEALSLTTFIPLLEFLQNSTNSSLEVGSSIWGRFFSFIYDSLGLEINILSLSILIVTLVLFRQIFNYLNVLNITKLKHKVGRDIADRCVSGIFSANALFIQSFKSGTFVNTVDHQSQLSAQLIRAFATLFGILITVSAYLIVMIITAPYASILAITIMAGIIIIVEKWVRLNLSLSKEVVDFRNIYINFLGDRYRNWRAIKISSSEKKEIKLAKTYSNKFYLYSVNMQKNSGKNLLIVSPLMTTFALIILYFSVNHLNLQIAEIAVFILILVRLIPVSQNMANQRQMVASALPGFQSIIKLLNKCEENIENVDSGENFIDKFDKIYIENLSFKYPSSKTYALRNINCSIPNNKKTAIIGRSGSGKSTLSDLIITLLKPTEGHIKYGDKSSTYYSIKSIRDRISYVSQQPLIFSASVYENVAYVKENASYEDVIKACKAAKAHDFIDNLPNKYDETLLEGGVNLSGGERQRLMLARVFLLSRDVIILDEATSSVDFDSENKINEALDLYAKGQNKTVIVIAHRISTIRSADHIIILDNGKLVSEGSPDKLKYDDNWYANMMKNN